MESPNQSAAITRLPADILAEIMDVCDSASSFVNLAFTCKDLRRACEPTLYRHRSAYELFRFTSDLDPACFPTLVRRVILSQDPLVIKYARSIDIWGTRLSWDEWRQYEVDERGVHMCGEVVEVQRFTENEVLRLMEFARALLGEGELTAAHEEIENGADGLLKFLAIAACPNLETVKFIRREDLLHKSCQVWLEKSIRYILDNDLEWPVGLRSLRDAAFGVDAGFLDEHIQVLDDQLQVDEDDSDSLAAFLRLPSLKTLYYQTESKLGDEHRDQDLPKQEWDLDPGCSGVESLYLDGVMGASHDFLEHVSWAPRKLKSLTVRFEGYDHRIDDPDTFLERLAENQADNLGCLMFYHPTGLRGYRCENYRPEDLEAFCYLKMWYQSTYDMELQALYDADQGDVDGEKKLIETFERYILPKTEVLVMDGDMEEFMTYQNSAWPTFDRAIAAVINKNAADTGSLKALFIPAPNKGRDDRRRQQAESSAPLPIVFPDAVRAAEDHNVDLYVSGNGRGTNEKKHVLEFPQAVVKWDIPSGPDYGRRVKDGFVTFNTFSGKWMHKSTKGNGYYIDLNV